MGTPLALCALKAAGTNRRSLSAVASLAGLPSSVVVDEIGVNSNSADAARIHLGSGFWVRGFGQTPIPLLLQDIKITGCTVFVDPYKEEEAEAKAEACVRCAGALI